MYIHIVRDPKQRKNWTFKGEIGNSAVKVGDSNTPLSIIYRTIQKINKDTEDFNSTINQHDVMDTDRVLHTMSTEYTFFSSTHVLCWTTKQVSIKLKRLKSLKACSISTNELSQRSPMERSLGKLT